MQQFNASVIISEQLNRLMVNAAQELAQRAVSACAEHYNFDAEEAIGLLGLNNVKLERKNAVVNEDEKKANNPKPKFPLPYNGEFNNDCCYALRPNNGLYTQCSASRKDDAQFCKSCVTQMQKTGSDMPEYGTIQQRQAVSIFEYVDPKGRKPLSYTKVMKKYKLTQDQVLEEAGKFNVSIDNNHFIIVEEEKKRGRRPTKNDDKKEKEKGVKGRPKKVKSVIQIEGDDDDEDLFATLVEEANAEANAEEELLTLTKDLENIKLSDDENEANELERVEREAIKERERVEREAKKEQERLEREAKKKAEEDAKAEKAAKKEQERLEREAKKKAEEEAKAEKAAKKEQERLEREAKKKEEDAKKQSKKKIEVEEEEEEEEEEPDIVKKIKEGDNTYLKSKKTGIVYDYKKYVSEGEQIKVGKWNETTNKIDFDDDEESEEEYDE